MLVHILTVAVAALGLGVALGSRDEDAAGWFCICGVILAVNGLYALYLGGYFGP